MWRFAQVSVFCLIFIGGALFLSLPGDVTAQAGLVPACPVGDVGCQNAYHPDNYGICELVGLANNVIQFLVGLISVFGALIMVYAGYLLVTSRGNVSQMERAKGMFTNVLIGIVIMLSAFLVVNTVLGILVGKNSPILDWNNFPCQYANEAGEASRESIKIGTHVNGIYLQSDWVLVGGNTGRYSYGVGGGGGSCSVVTDPSNACHPSKLSCFGNAQAASKVCNLESSGGQVKAVSGTDVCRDGYSFSGGLFQINVFAHYDKIPGCGGGFFTKNGGGVQGDCLRRVTNSNGVEYCAMRDCSITNVSLYNKCINAVMDPNTNLQIACNLYRADGWQPWVTSAGACGVI